jgi:hypothetical protein
VVVDVVADIVALTPSTPRQQRRPCAAAGFVPSTSSYAQMVAAKEILK